MKIRELRNARDGRSQETVVPAQSPPPRGRGPDPIVGTGSRPSRMNGPPVTCTKVHVTVRGTVLILLAPGPAPGTAIDTPGAGKGEQVERAVIVGGILISASFLAATALNRWEKAEHAPAQARPAHECATPAATDARSTKPRAAQDPCGKKSGAIAAEDVVKSAPSAQ
jgi:hypothetical protein